MNIRQIREKLHMTQLDLSIAVGVTPGTVSKWERGLMKPTGKLIICRLKKLERKAGQ